MGGAAAAHCKRDQTDAHITSQITDSKLITSTRAQWQDCRYITAAKPRIIGVNLYLVTLYFLSITSLKARFYWPTLLQPQQSNPAALSVRLRFISNDLDLRMYRCGREPNCNFIKSNPQFCLNAF